MPKKYGMHFRATQVLSSLDGGSNFPPFSLIDIKMCRYIRRYSVGTGHFRVLVPTESILIPTGSLYTHRSQIVPPESKRHAHRGHGFGRTGRLFSASAASSGWSKNSRLVVNHLPVGVALVSRRFVTL